MRSSISTSEEFYKTDSVIIGHGEVPGFRTQQGICWALPGNDFTFNRRVAEHYARRLDKIISANLRKFKRRLFK